jgi:uncharacterized protein (TIGR03083 family)
VLADETYRATLESSATAFIERVATADLTTPVPTCPGWDLADLARHLGSVHRWAAGCIMAAAEVDEPEGPWERADLVEWLTTGRELLVSLLRDADPRAPTWTFGQPRTVAFWSRRQAHETTLHQWDAAYALGSRTTIPAEVAADGVDEVLTMFFPRQVRLRRIAPLDSGVLIELADVPDSRYVLSGDGTDPAAATAARLRGSASDVLLALWGREGLDRLAIDGDPALVERILKSGIVP